MRTVFDDEEDERAEPDRELTLSTGTLLGLFFALVLLCGLCFGVGYTLGEHSSGATAAKQSEKPAEPALATKSEEKPSPVAGSAVAGGPGTAPGSSPGSAAPIADDLTAAPESAGSDAETAQSVASGQQAVQKAVQMVSGAAGQSVHPALPQNAGVAQPIATAAAGTVQPALPAASTAGIMVQVAAVSDPVDAHVLLDALKKRGYAVMLVHGATDNLMHVQVGPFSSRADALATRAKLLHDGYNAIVK